MTTTMNNESRIGTLSDKTLDDILIEEALEADIATDTQTKEGRAE